MTKEEKYRLAKIGALRLPPIVVAMSGKTSRGRNYWWFQPEGTDARENDGIINGVEWRAQRIECKSGETAYEVCAPKVYTLP